MKKIILSLIFSITLNSTNIYCNNWKYIYAPATIVSAIATYKAIKLTNYGFKSLGKSTNSSSLAGGAIEAFSGLPIIVIGILATALSGSAFVFTGLKTINNLK